MKTHSKGFTLLEVIISLAIAAGVFVAVLEAVNYQLSVVERYQDTGIAMMLGKEKIKELEIKPEETSGSFPDPYKDYHYESKIGDGPLPTLNIITLNITRGGDTTVLKVFVKK